MKPSKPTSKEPAAQKCAELLLDEPRQRVPLVDPRRLGPERPEVIAYHLVQRALCGKLRPVRVDRDARADP
jgi:hypothetical protein